MASRSLLCTSSMIPVHLIFSASIVLAGCDVLLDKDRPTNDGGIYDLTEHVPVDGAIRESLYADDDGVVDWSRWVGRTGGDGSSGLDVVTFEHRVHETGDVLLDVDWSSADQEVRIHGWASADGIEVRFSTPVLVGQGRLLVGDAFVTETDGFAFTSTLEAVEGCGTPWAPPPHGPPLGGRVAWGRAAPSGDPASRPLG